MTTGAGGSEKEPGGKKNEGGEDRARATELMVSLVLRSGVLKSAGVILLGLVLLAYHGFKGLGGNIDSALSFPHTFGRVFAGLAGLDPISVISLGLLLVIITPVTRVAVSIIAFVMERDWHYVAITAVVLAVLLVSFALGKGGS